MSAMVRGGAARAAVGWDDCWAGADPAAVAMAIPAISTVAILLRITSPQLTGTTLDYLRNLPDAQRKVGRQVRLFEIIFLSGKADCRERGLFLPAVRV